MSTVHGAGDVIGDTCEPEVRLRTGGGKALLGVLRKDGATNACTPSFRVFRGMASTPANDTRTAQKREFKRFQRFFAESTQRSEHRSEQFCNNLCFNRHFADVRFHGFRSDGKRTRRFTTRGFCGAQRGT